MSASLTLLKLLEKYSIQEIMAALEKLRERYERKTK